jgi:hypothetical protein
MEVGKELVHPNSTHLDNVPVDNASFAVVKVDMVHENVKNLKLEVPTDDTILTLLDAITRRVQWRRTCIDVDPPASVSTTPVQTQSSPLPLL